METNEVIAIVAAALAIPGSIATWRMVKPNSQSLVAEVHSRVVADVTEQYDRAIEERDEEKAKVLELQQQVAVLLDRTDMSKVYYMLDEQMRQAIAGRTTHSKEAEERTRRLEEGLRGVVEAIQQLKTQGKDIHDEDMGREVK